MPGFWDRCKPLMSRIGRWISTGVAVGLRELKATGAYYWAQRGGIWRLFAEYVTFFKEHGTRKEIWVSREEDYESVSFDGSGWRAELPDCCVVCGKPADEPWSDEERSLPILNWPLWAPIAAAGIGLVLSVYFSNRWLLPISVLAGLWLGYRRGAEACVRVRFRRCRQHVDKKSIPRLRFCKGSLVIDVGHRAVHRKFWERERGPAYFYSGRDDSSETVSEHPSLMPKWEPPDLDIPPIPLVGDDEVTTEARPDEQTPLGPPPPERTDPPTQPS